MKKEQESKQKLTRNRGAAFEPEQRDFIERLLKAAGLETAEGERHFGLSVHSLRNALNGERQDDKTRRLIQRKLNVPSLADLNKQFADDYNIQEQRQHNPFFVGRDAPLEAIREALNGSKYAAVTQALSGLGGIGKTATAIEYAYRCLNKNDFPDYPTYRAIQFTRADTRDTLLQGYAHIARMLKLPVDDPENPESAKVAVLRWMVDPGKAPWLLILDNLDDEPEIVNEFLPPPSRRHFGHVLITTRTDGLKLPHPVQFIRIEPLSEEEGVTFLYTRTGRPRDPGSNEEREARALVQALGGLPLALEQAATYMTVQTRTSFERYLTLFRSAKQRPDLTASRTGYGGYLGTVQTTWSLSLLQIQKECPAAVELLTLCAFLHSDRIPGELVYALLPAYFAPAGDDAAERALLYDALLTALSRYSLIQLDLNRDTLSLHVVVQVVLRDALSPEVQKRTVERILAALVATFPPEDCDLGGRGALFYLQAVEIHERAKAFEIEGAAISLLEMQMGNLLHRQARLDEAETLYTEALDRRRSAEPQNVFDLAIGENDLGQLYVDQGRFEEAEPLLTRARNCFESEHPNGCRELAACLNNLALLDWHRRRAETVLPLLEQALEMRQRTLRKGHPEIVESLTNLGEVCRMLGRVAEAERWTTEALTWARQAEPVRLSDVARCTSNLGLLYKDQKRYAEAEKQMLEALNVWKRAQSEFHPDAITCVNNLGALALEQERYEKAEEYLVQALERRKSVLPPGHTHIAVGLNNLANLHLRRKQFDRAEPMFWDAVEILTKALGPEHASTQTALTGHRLCLERMGHSPEA